MSNIKKILLILIAFLLTVPVLNAECDYKKEVELGKLASKVTYDRKYNKDTRTFTITLYNAIRDLVLSYNGTILNSDANNEIEINSVQEGTYMNIEINSANNSCYSSLMTLYINLPYHNDYYESAGCRGYEDVLEICSSEYISYAVNEKILNDAIENYNNKLKNEEIKKEDKEKQEEQKVSIVEKAENFLSKWGLKISLSLITTILTILVFQVKVRKAKHGI